jgi:hypothetical protein
MALLHIPLAQVDEGRLQALIAAGATEGRTIEDKRMTYGNMHADYSEFLADTSSFANTSGGDLVRGLREKLTEEERYRVANDVVHRLKQHGILGGSPKICHRPEKDTRRSKACSCERAI